MTFSKNGKIQALSSRSLNLSTEYKPCVQDIQAFLTSADPDSTVVIPGFEDPCLHPTSPSDEEVFVQTFKNLCSKALVVLERQLLDFIGNGVFAGSIPTDVLGVLQTCPLTNLVGERLFGDLDLDMSKRRRASLLLRSSINMWKRNKTGHWVRKKKKQEAVRLLILARSQREEARRRCRENEKEVRRQLRQNMEENFRRKQEKEVTERERHLKIVSDVLTQGGLCTSKESLDELIEEKNKVENLKAQIRYRKFVLNEKSLTLSGNCSDLYNNLARAIGCEVAPPLRKKFKKSET